MMATSPAERDVIAHHESGHGLVAYLFGAVRDASIIQDGDSLGRVHYVPPSMWQWYERTSSGLLVRIRALDIDPELLILAAGPEAETMFTGERNEEHARDDRKRAWELVNTISAETLGLRPSEWPRTRHRRKGHLDSKRSRARELLRSHESDLGAFAETLLTEKFMSAEAVDQFLGSRSIADDRIQE